MRSANIIISLIIIASFITGMILYPVMPDNMASHWNIKGEVDDYLPKFWGLFLMPIISLAILPLFIYIPMIDPLKNNIKKFRKYYDSFITLVIIFLAYIYTFTLLWNTGIRINVIMALIPALSILFIYVGVLLDHAKMNWFIGIRTPWTMSNEKVWNKTHKLGAKLFKIAGLVILTGLLFIDYAFIIMLTAILGVTIFLIAYSYVEYQKIKTR